VRYEILIAALDPSGIKEQFNIENPLPLAYSDSAKSFVVPQNTTLAERVLSRAATQNRTRLLDVFVSLATGIRPRVNRQAIRRRTPEARLAGRLFNYDDVTSKLLGDHSETFYHRTKDTWQWNSRYWEQVSLLKLAMYYRNPTAPEGLDALAKAVQHARFAVAIEHHPFGLTTLGKVLMAQMLAPEASMTEVYREAFDQLSQAIELEQRWSRSSVQPFVSLFAGTIRFLERKGALTSEQRDRLEVLAATAEDNLSSPVVLEQIAVYRRTAIRK
jgi:hypothetical protein